MSKANMVFDTDNVMSNKNTTLSSIPDITNDPRYTDLVEREGPAPLCACGCGLRVNPVKLLVKGFFGWRKCVFGHDFIRQRPPPRRADTRSDEPVGKWSRQLELRRVRDTEALLNGS